MYLGRRFSTLYRFSPVGGSGRCRYHQVSSFGRGLTSPLVFSNHEGSRSGRRGTCRRNRLRFAGHASQRLPSRYAPRGHGRYVGRRFRDGHLASRPSANVTERVYNFVPSPILPIRGADSVSSDFYLRLSPPGSTDIYPSDAEGDSNIDSDLYAKYSRQCYYSCLYHDRPTISF